MPFDDILLTNEKKNAIQDKGADKLPLNPTAQGFSGQQVRAALAAATTGNVDSILTELETKLGFIKGHFDDHEDRLTTAEGLITQTDTATKIIINVRNEETTAITKGMPVYIFSTLGASGTLTVKKATADHTVAPVKKLLGVVRDVSIAPNALGEILILGELTGLDTSSLTQGQPIYLGTTAGTLTSTVPTEPNHRIIVGVCAFTDVNNGAIYVKPQLGLELGELDDVRITNIQNGEILRYNTANLRWENSSDLPANNVDLQNHINSTTVHHLKGVANGVASLDGSGKIPLGQMPDAVFDSLYFFTVVGSTPPAVTNLTTLASNAFIDAAANNRNPLGYYFVQNSATGSLFLANPTGTELVAGKYYKTVWMPAEETEVTPLTNVRLEQGDWFVISKIQGIGTGDGLSPANAIVVTFAVVNNTYEIATTSVDGIVRLSNSTSIATVGNNVITDGRLNVLSGVQNGLATLDGNGLVPLTQLPVSVDDVTAVSSNVLFLNLATLASSGQNQNSFEKRYLVCGGNGTNINAVDIFRLPAFTSPTVAANYIFEKTLGIFGAFRQELILDLVNFKLFTTGGSWTNDLALGPLPSSFIEFNQFFNETRTGESHLYYDSYVYRLACDQNGFNANDQTRTFYGLPRKILINGVVYRGSIVQFTNNFNQFEDFTITQNGDFFAVMNQNNTTTVVIGTTIFNSGGNWETSQSGAHRITIVKLNPLAAGAANQGRIVIIEKI